jgi:hypothetical protein
MAVQSRSIVLVAGYVGHALNRDGFLADFDETDV